jgi:hypothetical protein
MVSSLYKKKMDDNVIIHFANSSHKVTRTFVGKSCFSGVFSALEMCHIINYHSKENPSELLEINGFEVFK